MESSTQLEDLRREQKLGEIKSILVVITSAMVLPLYFLFWLCDLIYAPELKWEFLALRGTIIPVAWMINFFNKRIHTLNGAYKLAFAYAATMGLPICVMVLLLNDPSTAYYAGLNLVAIATLTFIPWSGRLFTAASIAIFAPYYMIVLWLSRDASDYKAVLVNSFFIVSTVVISAVVRYFYERMRYRELSRQLELNREIERRKQMELAVIRARDEAIIANESKSAFLANMSHELRTPLNAIIGYSELLQDDATDSGMKTYVKDLQKIENGGRHLLSLINNLLDISKIESGRMDVYLESTDVSGLLKNVEALALPLAEKNNNKLTITVGEFGKMKVDQTKLQQILLNLVSNACKFTRNGAITLTVDQFQVTGIDWLRFEVTDTGIGMTPDQCNKIFDAFVQAELSTTKTYGGTGLGLTISQRFSRMMGGDILVNSRPGYGSTFIVYLPRDIGQSSQLTDEFRIPKDRRMSVRKIAVVDNDRVRRDSIEATLIQHCFDLSAANVDSSGVQFVKGIAPDVIVYDPMAGVEIVKLWHQHNEKSNLLSTPTILISTQPNQRLGSAFGFHSALDINQVLSQLGDYNPPSLTLGDTKSILLIGNSVGELQNTFKERNWSIVTAPELLLQRESNAPLNYEFVILELATLLLTTQAQTKEILKTLNEMDSKIILVVDEKYRLNHFAGFYATLKMLMNKNTMNEIEFNLLVAKLVKKSIRGSANTYLKSPSNAFDPELSETQRRA